MGDLSTLSPNLPGTTPDPTSARRKGAAATLSRNIAISLARVAVNSAVALVLPAYLTHRLPLTTYGAWVLILQLSAYVSFLDFGVQTGVAKFVAEYEARGDEAGASRHASAGFALMLLTGLLGVALTVVLAWQVPRLFHKMPAMLYRDVRISVVLVGVSLSFGLICSVFSAIFLGLQRYAVPMAIQIVNRVFFTASVLAAVFCRGSLATMGAAVAAVNVATALLQVAASRILAARIRVSLQLADYTVLRKMARYCLLLAIWTVGMLCVSGLDITIVGHYAYDQTAYYSIATLPASLVLVILSSMLGPLMPASSALSTQRSPREMGAILSRTTRYCTALLLLTGLPLIVCGFPVLRLWVGTVYALSSLRYLRILILANILRNVCQPYATMLSATSRQGAATATAISEAVVNLGSSIYLASRFGAIGVAWGTLLGSFVSVALHFALSMHLTRETLAISRLRLFFTGVLRPSMIALPSICLLPFWWTSSRLTRHPGLAAAWAVSTLLLSWFVALNGDERCGLVRLSKNRLAPAGSGS